MNDDDQDKAGKKGIFLGRRAALQTLGVLGAAAAVGCEEPSAGGPDAGGSDASGDEPDAARIGRDAGPPPTGPFQHGVASGDPLADAVILWTRISEASAAVMVEWEMSTDSSFGTIAAMGMAMAEPARDYTVKVDASGLAAATTYYYRFRAAGETSPIGRTRTAPADAAAVARLRFGVCSCSSLAHGWFHAYRRLAERADLDAIIHLGDYIYEYGTGEYGDVRAYEPAHEIVSLEDYRMRYAQYRRDPDLQACHRQHPFITVWDDHETTNDSWRDGAENHDASEGSYATRKMVAAQAYDEWMPIRTNVTEGPSRIWRELRYGDLAELYLLDTRIWARTEQGVGAEDTRDLLGPEQEAWLLGGLAASDARWKLVCQQVMFAQLPQFLNEDAWDGYPAARARIIEALRTGGDGGAAIRDAIILTGDIHMSWAMEIVEDIKASPLPAPAAVEFVAPGISSPGLPGTQVVLDAFVRTVMRDSPHVRYADPARRGYFVLDLTPARASAAWFHVEDVTDAFGDAETFAQSWGANAGSSVLTQDASAAAPRSDAPPLAP